MTWREITKENVSKVLDIDAGNLMIGYKFNGNMWERKFTNSQSAISTLAKLGGYYYREKTE